MRLKPVQYQLKAKDLDIFLRKDMPEASKKFIEQTDYSQAESLIRTGFLAQEVDEAAKETDFNFDGIYVPKNENDYYAVSYSSFVVPLVKGMQEQQSMIDALKKQNTDLQKQIDELKSMIKK
jgi:hypothetical protein